VRSDPAPGDFYFREFRHEKDGERTM
jgi:hypothetical protein